METREWSKATRTNTKRETITVRQVENGFIKTIDLSLRGKCMCGKDEDGDNDDNCKCDRPWKYTTKQYISTDNPMDEKPLIDKLSSIINNL